MPAWRYRVEDWDGAVGGRTDQERRDAEEANRQELENLLNALGGYGWEVAAIAQDALRNRTRVILKAPVDGGQPAT